MENSPDERPLRKFEIKERPEGFSPMPSSEAYTNDPQAVCAGGKPLGECDTTGTMLEKATEETETLTFGQISGEIWRILQPASRTCQTCSHYCEVAVQAIDRKPTGVARFRFYPKETEE